MNFTDNVFNGIENFFTINGRMKRSSFWWFALFCVIVVLFVDFLVIIANGSGVGTARFINICSDIAFFYVLIVPGIRRLHDIDKGGENILWIFLPVLGWIYLVYLFCLPSDPDDNYFGEV